MRATKKMCIRDRDEAVGTAVDIAGFNRYLLDCIHRDAGVPVYTIHA